MQRPLGDLFVVDDAVLAQPPTIDEHGRHRFGERSEFAQFVRDGPRRRRSTDPRPLPAMADEIGGGALRGAGDTFVPSIFFVASHWLIIVGGGWWIASRFPQMGSLGPWIAASVLIGVTAIFLIVRWYGESWRKIDLFGSGSDDWRRGQGSHGST